MIENHFWYTDDEHGVRWAVRVSHPFPASGRPLDAASTVVFTSRERQLVTSCPPEKEDHELSRYELLELLGRAKREMVVEAARLGELAA